MGPTLAMEKAYLAFKSALRAGRIIKPRLCEQCGQPSKSRATLDAHHDDYSKPLEVRWLCRSCHVRHHHALRIAAKAALRQAA